MKDQGGEMVSRLPQLIVLWSGAPSSGTACSLELSLLSPAGIWFKTPLPVGGANTAVHTSASEAGSVGVAIGQRDRGIPTKPAGGLPLDIGFDDPRL